MYRINRKLVIGDDVDDAIKVYRDFCSPAKLTIKRIEMVFCDSSEIDDSAIIAEDYHKAAETIAMLTEENEKLKAEINMPRVVILDEDKLQADVAQAAVDYPDDHWTMDQIRKHLAGLICLENNEGGIFGDSVSKQNPDLCLWYEVLYLGPIVRVFRYKGCHKG